MGSGPRGESKYRKIQAPGVAKWQIIIPLMHDLPQFVTAIVRRGDSRFLSPPASLLFVYSVPGFECLGAQFFADVHNRSDYGFHIAIPCRSSPAMP